MTSTIKVNKIEQQCGTTLTVGGGACKTAVIDANTITLGNNSGTSTISLNTGAAFGGGIGAVMWETTPQTGSFGATKGKGYFMNTTSGPLTLTTPASPSAGDIFAVADYSRTFNTNNLTISPHASAKIGGVAQDAKLTVNGQSATFVYVDGTEGWINVQETQTSQTGIPPYMCATGGTITESGNFKIHTFTGPGTFTVNRVATESPAPAHNTVSYMVVAGGGGGGAGNIPAHGAGGGGAGGYREGKNAPIDSYTASPLNAPAGVLVTAQDYPITVGGGGPSGPGCAACQASDGTPSTALGITSTAGGGGSGSAYSPPDSGARMNGRPGGSGGGGSSQGNPSPTPGGQGGSGNTPSVSPPQGNDGGSGTDSPPNLLTGGGGGATASGTGGTACTISGAGGAGATSCITGSPVARAGGGGGGGAGPSGQQDGGAGGTGGGGPGGGHNPPGSATPGTAGTANTGGGGGGGKGGPDGSPGIGSTVGGAGGSGVVVIRYKFQ